MKGLLLMAVMILFWAGRAVAAESGLPAAETMSSVEERRLLVSIEDEYAKLDQRKAEIAERELALKTLEAEVDKKLAAMKALRTELTQLLERKKAVEGERVGELSAIYEKMEPQKAAALIKGLDQQLAVDLLLSLIHI